MNGKDKPLVHVIIYHIINSSNEILFFKTPHYKYTKYKIIYILIILMLLHLSNIMLFVNDNNNFIQVGM